MSKNLIKIICFCLVENIDRPSFDDVSNDPCGYGDRDENCIDECLENGGEDCEDECCLWKDKTTIIQDFVDFLDWCAKILLLFFVFASSFAKLDFGYRRGANSV